MKNGDIIKFDNKDFKFFLIKSGLMYFIPEGYDKFIDNSLKGPPQIIILMIVKLI
jgi:hypothetical protein